MGHAKSSDPNVFILPDLGEGVHEAELLKWCVREGQRVNEHDVLAELNTDKAQVEVPSPRAGVIASLHGSVGEILKVGHPLVTYASEGGAAAPASAAAPAAGATGPSCDTGSQIASHVPSNGKHASPSARAEAEPEREDAGTVVGSVGGALAGLSAAPGKALATPAVRRLARDLGVDIDRVAGSGIGGRVTEKDVRAATSRSAAPAAPAARATPAAPAPTRGPSAAAGPTAPASPAPAPAIPAGADSVRIPFRGVRRTIANRLRESVSTAVHFTVMDEADVSGLDALRRRLAAASGEKLSLLPFVASAVARCLTGEFAALNATVDDPASEIIRHRAVHLGIAADTDAGLMVPVVRDAEKLGVLQLAREIARVASAARDRSASREALMGSTFTISNVGSHAGRFATPVINYPEVGIIAVGRMRDGPVVRQGLIGVGKLLPLSLACDHRVIDGATAALCLARIVELLQHAGEELMTPARP